MPQDNSGADALLQVSTLHRSSNAASRHMALADQITTIRIFQAHRRHLLARVIVLEQTDPVLRQQRSEQSAEDEREVFNAFVTARLLRLAERFA